MIDREGKFNNELECVPQELHKEFWVQRYLGMGIIPLIIEAGTTAEKQRYDGLNNLQHALEVGHIIGQNTSIPIGSVPGLQLAVIMHDTILDRQNRPVRTFEEFQPVGYSQMTHEVLSRLAEYVNEPFFTEVVDIQ